MYTKTLGGDEAVRSLHQASSTSEWSVYQFIVHVSGLDSVDRNSIRLPVSRDGEVLGTAPEDEVGAVVDWLERAANSIVANKHVCAGSQIGWEVDGLRLRARRRGSQLPHAGSEACDVITCVGLMGGRIVCCWEELAGQSQSGSESQLGRGAADVAFDCRAQTEQNKWKVLRPMLRGCLGLEGRLELSM